MQEGLMNSKFLGRKFSLCQSSIFLLMLLCIFEVEVHRFTCVHASACTFYHMCGRTFRRSLTSEHLFEIQNPRSPSPFPVYLKEVQVVFKEQQDESGPSMRDTLSHIDSVLFECVCVYVFFHMYVLILHPNLFRVPSIIPPHPGTPPPPFLLHIKTLRCQLHHPARVQ